MFSVVWLVGRFREEAGASPPRALTLTLSRRAGEGIVGGAISFSRRFSSLYADAALAEDVGVD